MKLEPSSFITVIQTFSVMVPLPLDGRQHSASLKEGVPIYLSNAALVWADAQRGLLKSNRQPRAHRQLLYIREVAVKSHFGVWNANSIHLPKRCAVGAPLSWSQTRSWTCLLVSCTSILYICCKVLVCHVHVEETAQVHKTNGFDTSQQGFSEDENKCCDLSSDAG